MFDIGLGEVLVLIVAGLFVFGPDRLPQVVAQAVRTLRQVRTLAAGARADITEAIGPELRDLNIMGDLDEINPLSDVNEIRNLSPRKILNNAMFGSGDKLSDAVDGTGATATAGSATESPANGSGPEIAPGHAPAPAPAFDADAT